MGKSKKVDNGVVLKEIHVNVKSVRQNTEKLLENYNSMLGHIIEVNSSIKQEISISNEMRKEQSAIFGEALKTIASVNTVKGDNSKIPLKEISLTIATILIVVFGFMLIDRNHLDGNKIVDAVAGVGE